MNLLENTRKLHPRRRRYVKALGVALYYIVVVAVLAFFFFSSPHGTVPFVDGFESGDSSAWTPGVMTQGTGAVSFVNNNPVYKGNWAMKCQITTSAPNTDFAEINENFGTDHSTIYMRVYFQVTALPSNGQAVELVELCDNVHRMNNFGLGYSENTPQWRLTYLKNGGYTILYASSPTPTVNTWYCIELMVTVDGKDGIVKGYINGALVFSDSAFKNNDYGNVSVGTCGLDTWTNENYPNVGYFDEIAISNQFID